MARHSKEPPPMVHRLPNKRKKKEPPDTLEIAAKAEVKPKKPAGNKTRKSRVGRAKAPAVLAAIEGVYGSPLEFWRQIALRAHDGDANAAKMLADRMFPSLKPVGPQIQFELDTSNPTALLGSILENVSNGTLPIDSGVQLLAAARAMLDVSERKEVLDRMAELEKLLGVQDGE